MSTTCALISRRPSSKTAKRPQGPATITIESASIRLASSRVSRAGKGVEVMPSPHPRRLSELLGRHAYNEAVERVRNFDLAGETTAFPHVEREVEHILFHLRWLSAFLPPPLVDIDVARRASAGPATLR